MLDEMRKIALLILMDTLFKVDYTPELTRLWDAVLRLIQYVSPGLWLVWSGVPHRGYYHARAQVDAYWFQIIRERRSTVTQGDDMLSLLVQSEMPEALIRDQLMTMLVAGHDTTTAMLAWAFYVLGQHPNAIRQAQAEIDSVIGTNSPDADNTHPTHMPYLNAVIQETMRLYPPLPFGSRIATADLDFNGYPIPKGSRLLYSIFLTQRHPDLWGQPDDFMPARFMPHTKHEHPHPHYAYLPFGGGARICLGVAYAQVETRVVLARVLQQFNVVKRGGKAHMHMGVTVEPRPGVLMQPTRR
jgi:cytochrome P450